MPAGLLQRQDRPEYARAIRAASEGVQGKPVLPANPLPTLFEAALDREFRLVIAGSAGGKVRSAAASLAKRRFCRVFGPRSRTTTR